MHRPVQEFMFASNVMQLYGVKGEAVNCQAMNMGLFATALTNGNTAWMSTGGASNNDFYTIYHSIHMSAARMSGSAGTSKILKGARVFKMQQSNDATYLNMSSYSVDEQGNINAGFTVRYPPSFSFGYQWQCGVDPYEHLVS